MATSLALIPFAYLIGIVDKIKGLGTQTGSERFLNNLLFIPCGVPILVFDFLLDQKYFWKNNFRTDLQEIIIPKEKSLISHKSIKEVQCMGDKYIDNKIKTSGT